MPDLRHSHFGKRLKERFDIDFTPVIKRELLQSIKLKKAKLLNTDKRFGKTSYNFYIRFRGVSMIFIVLDNGEFVTCIPKSYYRGEENA